MSTGGRQMTLNYNLEASSIWLSSGVPILEVIALLLTPFTFEFANFVGSIGAYANDGGLFQIPNFHFLKKEEKTFWFSPSITIGRFDKDFRSLTSSCYHKWWCIVRNPSTQFWVYLQAKWGCVTNCKTFRFIRKIKVDNLGSICTIWNKCFVFCFVQQLASTHWDHNKAIQNWYYTFFGCCCCSMFIKGEK